ncbi:hypothetical protein PV328_003793 [Microctonus aethiopoides]|uniref:Uncharacterized protein n=1 Tax=Microctonus aethiopoides TaxID=144406 RepID=A0AA39F981_9HYME|nr:hypothetical protein PV328_003793 [Microctonus aethiopoides]
MTVLNPSSCQKVEGLLHSGDFCREDEDHFQNTAQAETFLRRTSVEGEEVKPRLHPAMPSPSHNKNSNINLNSAPAFAPPAAGGGAAASPAAPSADSGKDAGIEGAFTEWWEIVTERIPTHARRTFSKSDTPASANNFETIKSLINKGQTEGTLRRELVSNYGTSYGQNRKSVSADAPNHHEARKNTGSLHDLQLSRRSKQSQSSPSSGSSTGFQRSLKAQETVLKNRQAEETPPNIHNELHRKSTENSNANTNLNHMPRRSMISEPTNHHAETRKSTNTNKNVNVNDHGGGGGAGGGSDIFELYEKLSDADVGPKALGGHMNRPIAERSHSNVNRNVNANVHGDMLPSALLVPDDLRRNLLAKKRYYPRAHHPNDNHNVNININGEEPMDDLADDAQADPGSEPEANTSAAPVSDS